MTDTSIDAYLKRFEAALGRFGVPHIRDIGADVRSHILEALDYGKSLDVTLRALGAPEALARSYAIELLSNRPAKASPWMRALQLTGLLAATSAVSAVVVLLLGSIGVTFIGSAFLLLSVGLLETAGIHLPNVQTADLSPWIFVALAPVFFLIGWGCCVLLMRYLRAVARGLARRLPIRRSAQ
jgi:uncharacterized membrane protein